MLTTDEWGSYARELPKEKHLTGKIFTQHIERNNLTLRTRIKRLARRTICFSRSVELHKKSSVLLSKIYVLLIVVITLLMSFPWMITRLNTQPKIFTSFCSFFSNDIYYILHHIHRHMTFPRPPLCHCRLMLGFHKKTHLFLN